MQKYSPYLSKLKESKAEKNDKKEKNGTKDSVSKTKILIAPGKLPITVAKKLATYGPTARIIRTSKNTKFII